MHEVHARLQGKKKVYATCLAKGKPIKSFINFSDSTGQDLE